ERKRAPQAWRVDLHARRGGKGRLAAGAGGGRRQGPAPRPRRGGAGNGLGTALRLRRRLLRLLLPGGRIRLFRRRREIELPGRQYDERQQNGQDVIACIVFHWRIPARLQVRKGRV